MLISDFTFTARNASSAYPSLYIHSMYYVMLITSHIHNKQVLLPASTYKVGK